MEQNPYMIGDWLHAKSQDVISKVIDVEKESVWLEEKSCWSRLFLNEVEPVPITGEILDKNGFTGSNVFIEWKYETRDIYILWKPFPWIKILTDDTKLVFPCEYVHELQHALRLLNINIDIQI